MTYDEYIGTLRGLNTELESAMEAGDENRREGAAMALQAFLSVVRPPPPPPVMPKLSRRASARLK